MLNQQYNALFFLISNVSNSDIIKGGNNYSVLEWVYGQWKGADGKERNINLLIFSGGLRGVWMKRNEDGIIGCGDY